MGHEQRPPRTCDLVIQNGTVLTLDDERNVIHSGMVAIDGTDIVGVGTGAEIGPLFTGREVVDAGGAIVHPGFVDAHMHVAHHVIRAAEADDMPYPDQAVFHTEF